MGIYSWDSFGSPQKATRTPRLTIRCEYPDTDMLPTEVSFGLSPSYGFLTARDAHEWVLEMMRDQEEFEVETDRAGELPMPSGVRRCGGWWWGSSRSAIRVTS